MATKRYSAQDFQSIPAIGFVVEGLASAPSSPANGRIYFDTGVSKYGYYTGSAWVYLDNIPGAGVITNSMVASGAAIAESKLTLASDAAAGTASRRTLGTSSTQAFPGNGRLDQLAAPTASVSLNSQLITNLLDPVSAQDAATKNWVLTQISTQISGQDWKTEVRAATTAALPANTYANGSSGVGATLTGNANGALAAVDGITLAAGDRVLVKNEATGANNGIYSVTQAGDGTHPYILTRTTDANTGGAGAGLSNGATVPVLGGGTTNGGTIWALTSTPPFTIGTTALTFSQIGGAGATYTAGTGLTLSSNQFSLTTPVSVANGGTNATSASAARTSLGITAWQKYSATLGALTAGTPLSVTHSLGTTEVIVQVRDASTGAIVDIDLIIVDANTVSVTSANNVSTSALKIVVLG